MAGQRASSKSSNSRRGGPKYPRGARVGATLREIIADELVRIGDERLEFVTVTSIDVDPELNRAIVFFDSLSGEEGDEEILEAFGDHRVRLQSAIARQIRAKKTPILNFRPDEVIRSAERIDQVLRADTARLARLDNQVTEPDEVVTEPDTAVIEPDDALTEPDDALTGPDDALTEPDDAVIEPDER